MTSCCVRVFACVCICVPLLVTLVRKLGLLKQRVCIHPAHHAPASGVLGPVLRFNRHQSFVEFGNGFALLINCGGGSKAREHARYVSRSKRRKLRRVFLSEFRQRAALLRAAIGDAATSRSIGWVWSILCPLYSLYCVSSRRVMLCGARCVV